VRPREVNPVTFSADQARYARHIALPEIGVAGQKKLGASSVLIVGCGGLGCTQSMLLVRAGIGRLVIADRDVVELHNLHRQFLFDERQASERLPKAVAASSKLREINSSVQIEAFVADINESNIDGFLKSVDLVLDGTDNLETRYLINDACVKASKPWVYGGVLGMEGSVMAIQPAKGPCLRCLLPEPPDSKTLPTCVDAGVLNAAVAWVAALQTTEATKLLLGDPVAEYFVRTMNIWTGRFASISVNRKRDCVCCGKRR
jgi:molybdopterin/thiamine biosynthesis adenylyltransferase